MNKTLSAAALALVITGAPSLSIISCSSAEAKPQRTRKANDSRLVNNKGERNSAKREEKLAERQAKREEKLAERQAKREEKQEKKKNKEKEKEKPPVSPGYPGSYSGGTP
jgi:precorrin-2 methylase